MTVLVTGGASGIGRAVIEKFRTAGDSVYSIDINETEDSGSFVADVTDEAALFHIAERLRAMGVTLDTIINVAGIHRMHSFVEGECAVARKLIEINLIGAMQVNRIFHPLLAKDGRIIIVTSEVAELDPLPFNGLYSVSKIALDAYSQALRQELGLIGQKVITVRPGAVQTPLSSSSLDAASTLAENTVLFKKQAHKFHTLTKRFMGKPIPPEKIASIIYRASRAKRPKLVYKKHRNPGLILLGMLPKSLQCALIKMLLKH